MSSADSVYEARVKRAHEISARLKAAKDLRDLCSEISKALLPTVSMPRFSPGPWLDESSHSAYRLVVVEAGGLTGKHRIDDVVIELAATYVSPVPTPGKKKKRIARPTFPFFVGGLSALVARSDLDFDAKRLCEAGRNEARLLAAAAVHVGDVTFLNEIQSGMSAVTQVDYRHVNFSRHVSAALRSYRILLEEKKGVEPRKGEVRRRAEELLREIEVEPLSDSARWREIFAAAVLSHLEQERGIR